ncbi:MAG: penicillin-binding protein 1A [Nitrospirota bacterium]
MLKIKLIIIAVISAIAVSCGASYALITSVDHDLPAITSLKNYKPPIGTRVYSEDNHLIGRIKVDKGIFVPLSQMPDELKNAVIAVEDSRFYTHGALDFEGIARAFVTDIFSLSFKQGGSTITQQLAKVLFLTPEKSISRKLKEMVLARKIEQKLTKNEILELYLNKIYFGHGAYGVEMAARTYFGKHVGDLNLSECAMIAGLIRSPEGYSPYNNMQMAKRRQEIVLKRMVEERLISQGQANLAAARPLVLRNLRTNEEVAPYLVEQIRIYLEKKYGPEKVYIEGLNVKTAIDYRMQVEANRAVESGARELAKRQGWRGPLAKKDPKEVKKLLGNKSAVASSFQPGEIVTATVLKVGKKGAVISTRGGRGYLAWPDMRWAAGRDPKKKNPADILKPGYVIEVKRKAFNRKVKLLSFTLEQDPVCEAALVAIDPSDGKVKALVGGVDFQKSQFNHATMAHRQPGSAFKPLVYATAMENGFTPASIINDEPRSYDNNHWKPNNYDHEYYGPTRLREALVFSRNVVTIELLNRIGVQKVIDLATKLGMTGPFARNLTLALGSCSATPLEMTSAYCAFANGGYDINPITIMQVTDRRGRILEQHESPHVQVMSPEATYQVTSMLEDAVQRGTGRLAASLGRPVAGKTGTTNDYRDAWFVGYTPQLVAGVWVGFDDQESLGHGESGARAALPIWVRFMAPATASEPPDDFTVPDDMDFVKIDASTGLLPTSASQDVITEVFKKGTEPTEYSSTMPQMAPASSQPSSGPTPAKAVIDQEKQLKLLQDVD